MVVHLVPPSRPFNLNLIDPEDPVKFVWLRILPFLKKNTKTCTHKAKLVEKSPKSRFMVDHRGTCWPLPLIKYDFTQYITVSACIYVIWEQGRSRFSIGFGSMRLFLEYRSQPWPSLSPPGWSWMDPGPVVVCFMTSLGIPSWSLSASGSLFNSRIYRSIMGLSVILAFKLEIVNSFTRLRIVSSCGFFLRR